MELENSRKLDSLDDALLFAIGLVSLIITLIQIDTYNASQVIEAIPFIILGILLPFIVGYMKGAIEFNSVEERIRGWIYFIIGTFSYFAFFAVSRLQIPYILTESVFVTILIIGVIVTYLFIQWANRIFDVKNPGSIYAYSGTVFGAATCAWLLRALASVYLDFQGKDLFFFLINNSTFLFFWVTICLFSFSIVIMFEKISSNALRNEIKPDNSQRRISRLFFVKGTKLGLRLLAFSFSYDIKHALLLSESFIFWAIGSFLLALNLSILAIIFFGVAIAFWLMATFFLNKISMNNFEGIENVSANTIWYLLLVAVSVILAVLGGNIISLLEVIGLLTIYYLLLYYSKPTKAG